MPHIASKFKFLVFSDMICIGAGATVRGQSISLTLVWGFLPAFARQS